MTTIQTNKNNYPTVYFHFIEDIINKKVNKTALNCIENLIDFLLTYSSRNYTDLFILKQMAHEFKYDAHNIKVCRFLNGILLFDCTKNKIADITTACRGNLKYEQVSLNKFEVNFSALIDGRFLQLFKKETTKYIVVEDTQKQNFVKITDQRILSLFPDRFQWTINTEHDCLQIERSLKIDRQSRVYIPHDKEKEVLDRVIQYPAPWASNEISVKPVEQY